MIATPIAARPTLGQSPSDQADPTTARAVSTQPTWSQRRGIQVVATSTTLVERPDHRDDEPGADTVGLDGQYGHGGEGRGPQPGADRHPPGGQRRVRDLDLVGLQLGLRGPSQQPRREAPGHDPAEGDQEGCREDRGHGVILGMRAHAAAFDSASCRIPRSTHASRSMAPVTTVHVPVPSASCVTVPTSRASHVARDSMLRPSPSRAARWSRTSDAGARWVRSLQQLLGGHGQQAARGVRAEARPAPSVPPVQQRAHLLLRHLRHDRHHLPGDARRGDQVLHVVAERRRGDPLRGQRRRVVHEKPPPSVTPHSRWGRRFVSGDRKFLGKSHLP